MKTVKIGNIVIAMVMWTFLSSICFASGAAEPATDSLFNLKSEWTDQNDRKISLSELKGRPAFVAMIYTSCQSACPLIVEDMQKIEKLIPAGEKDQVHFALFSFDSNRDTTTQLKKFSKDHGLGSNWILAHGSSKSVRELAAALGIQYRQSSSGDFQHSNLITLLDKEGVIKKQQAGLGNKGDEMVETATQLIKK